MSTYTRTIIPTYGTLVVSTCWCGIQFAMPAATYEWHRSMEENATYCPLGHAGYVRKTDVQAEREKRRRAEADAAFWRQRNNAAQEETAALARSNASLRGHLTRWRKRVANGVCPVAGCHRHFPNVQAHVTSEHPDWLTQHPEVFEDAALEVK